MDLAMKKAVIVSGGRINQEFCRDYIEQLKPDALIAVDSGMKFFYDTGLKPDKIIGDFDSADAEILQFFQQQKEIEWKCLVPEKDDTDTEAAIRWVLSDGCEQIHVLGGTGSRLDHVLGNIELLGIGLQAGVEIFLTDEQNRIRMIDKTTCVKRAEQYGAYVSLIPFTAKVTGVTLSGMKYPLTEAELVCYNSVGISNEIIEDEAVISIKEGVLLLLETRD